MNSVVARLYVALAAASFTAYVLMPSAAVKDGLYVGIGILCVVGTAAGIRMHRPRRAHVWWCVLVGMILWAVAGTIKSAAGEAPSSTAALLPDSLFLLGYAVFAASLLMLVGGRALRRDLAGVLESAMVTFGLAILAWVFIGRPTLDSWDNESIGTVMSLAFPAMDILLIGGLVRMIMTPGARTVAYRLILIAVTMLVASDLTLAVALMLGTSADYVHVAYFACYALWGAAALHPSMAVMTAPGPSGRHLTPGRMVTLAVACAVAPGVLAVEALLGTRIDVWAIVVGSIAMSALVMTRMAIAIRAITASQREREKLQADLVYQANHDDLTGLPNRALAVDAIAAALGRAQRGGYLIGLLFVDLDGFKNVNDTFGHAAGDEVLQATATRLHEQVRAGDLVARLGGDEFVVLLEHFDTEDDALVIARRLVAVASEPVVTSRGATVRIGASVGMAVAQDGSLDPDRLLQEADAAVYRAKHAGRGRVEVFGEGLRRELTERTEIDAALERAIDEDELVVHYQPIMDINSGCVRGYEALVRWERPGYGLLAPSEFIPAAERSTIVCDLDLWVLRKACRQLAEWTRDMAAEFTIAVNVSGRHLSSPRIVDDVRTALDDSGLAPGRLVLEITETMLLEDLLALEHLQQLRGLGVAISMDDFGTGYNSIARLRQLPIDILKIDRSFVTNIDRTAKGTAIVAAVIHLAHALDLRVVTEGVETATQQTAVTNLGADQAQGFLYSRPVGPDDIDALLASAVTPTLP